MTGGRPDQACSEPTRDQRRRGWKAFLGDARKLVPDVARVFDHAVAERLGIGKTQWRRILDLGDDDALHLHDVEALPVEMARAVVERLARRFGLEVRERAPEAEDDTRGGLARFARLQAEVHDVLRVYLAAVEKGVLLGDAASSLIREIDEAVRELQALRAIAERAAKVRALHVDARSEASRDARATR